MSDVKQVHSSHYNMFKELMNAMLLKVKEGKMTISHQIRNNNGDENQANEMKLCKRT